MSAAQWLGLLGTLLGGALPWLEAVVVIPAGIVAGLPTVPVVIAAVTGNLLTVALAAWFGERIMVWWSGRRQLKWLKNDAATAELRAAKRPRRQRQVSG